MSDKKMPPPTPDIQISTTIREGGRGPSELDAGMKVGRVMANVVWWVLVIGLWVSVSASVILFALGWGPR